MVAVLMRFIRDVLKLNTDALLRDVQVTSSCTQSLSSALVSYTLCQGQPLSASWCPVFMPICHSLLSMVPAKNVGCHLRDLVTRYGSFVLSCWGFCPGFTHCKLTYHRWSYIPQGKLWLFSWVLSPFLITYSDGTQVPYGICVNLSSEDPHWNLKSLCPEQRIGPGIWIVIETQTFY